MIHDKFTAIRHTMSRQQLWQIRRNAEGKCCICSKPLAPTSKTRCVEHAKGSTISNFKNQRKKLGIPLDWPKHKRFNK